MALRRLFEDRDGKSLDDSEAVDKLIEYVRMLYRKFEHSESGRKWLVEWVVNVGIDYQTKPERALAENPSNVFRGSAEMTAMLAETSLKRLSKLAKPE